MNLSLRALTPVVCAAIVCGRLGICAGAQAQDPSSTFGQAESVTKDGPQKPVRDSGWVTTSDPVALLTVRPAPKIVEAPATETVAQGAEPSSPEAATHEKASQLMAIEKQIREKQARIALLMRLFVNDERPFLNNPANPREDAAAQERRKYEQDELLWERAELARLNKGLNVLTAAKYAKKAFTCKLAFVS